MAIPPKAFYMLNVVPTKIPVPVLTEIENTTLKFTKHHK
jgi:hypothetical protein